MNHLGRRSIGNSGSIHDKRLSLTTEVQRLSFLPEQMKSFNNDEQLVIFNNKEESIKIT